MKITRQQLMQMIREGLLRESRMPTMAQTKEAPMPLKSLATPEFAAAIKGRKINEVVLDIMEEILGILNDEIASEEKI